MANLKSNESHNSKEKTNKKVLWIAIIAIALIALCLTTVVSFVTDYWWFKDLGYTQVFFKKLFTELKIGIPMFAILTILLEFYLHKLKKSYLKKLETKSSNASEKSISRTTHIICLAFSLFLSANITSSLWQQILYAMNSTDFNATDPIFNNDVSFYVFKLALLNSLTSTTLSLALGFAFATVFYYLYLISVRRPVILDGGGASDIEYAEVINDDDIHNYDDDGSDYNGSSCGEENESYTDDGPKHGILFDLIDELKKGHSAKSTGGTGGTGGVGGSSHGSFRSSSHGNSFPTVKSGNIRTLASIGRVQILALVFVFLLIAAGTIFLKQYDLLYSSVGTVKDGAGYTDVHITLWVYRIEFILALASAVGVIIFGKKRKYKRILILPVITICVAIAGAGVGAAVQALYVSPDELNKETKYLESSISMTQAAYDLENVTAIDFAASDDLDAEGILENSATLSNVRINDFSPSEQFYNQTQSIRTYYNFFDVDVDRYMIDGEYTQTFLSAREINYDKLGDDVSWLSKHLKYTHGYGVTLSRVDAITSTGQPDMIIDNIPPESDTDDLKITRPEIYFGESTNNYIITNTSEKEFDYPSGTSNVYTEYKGDTGIKLSLFKRLFYAIEERNIKILVSTNINKDSKILYTRNIMDRVTKLAPFLSYDSDPYIIVTDSGELYWIIDAYTASSYYPYSRSSTFSDGSSINYVRNPIKVVINAYDGSTDFYQVSDEPIADTISKIYPGLIKDSSQMPEEIAAHIRYPSTLFDIQAKIYQRYHMNDVAVFYQNEDKWSISTEIYGQEEKEMEPNYYIMKLPGEESEEFISSIPFTPSGKKNMTGLLIARSDGDNYGELVLYRLPKDKVVYGPMQIESQIDQNTEISKEFSLWNSSGSTYTRGDMFVIPINDSILYCEPVYLESASDTSLPEVKRVIVAYGDKIAYEPTLSEALISLFSLDPDYTPNGNKNSSADVDDSGGSASNGTADGAGGGDASNGAADGAGGDGGDSVDNSGASDVGDASLTELASLAATAYDNALAAQKEGDWASYGKYLDELEGYLNQMKQIDA